MLPLMDDFRKWGCSESPTFKFWDMFLNAIEILLQNIRSFGILLPMFQRKPKKKNKQKKNKQKKPASGL